ncbi:hypothetical protein EI555_007401, partial [Monodon monoceros]
AVTARLGPADGANGALGCAGLSRGFEAWVLVSIAETKTHWAELAVDASPLDASQGQKAMEAESFRQTLGNGLPAPHCSEAPSHAAVATMNDGQFSHQTFCSEDTYMRLASQHHGTSVGLGFQLHPELELETNLWPYGDVNSRADMALVHLVCSFPVVHLWEQGVHLPLLSHPSAPPQPPAALLPSRRHPGPSPSPGMFEVCSPGSLSPANLGLRAGLTARGADRPITSKGRTRRGDGPPRVNGAASPERRGGRLCGHLAVILLMRTCVAQALRHGAGHGLPGPYSPPAASRPSRPCPCMRSKAPSAPGPCVRAAACRGGHGPGKVCVCENYKLTTGSAPVYIRCCTAFCHLHKTGYEMFGDDGRNDSQSLEEEGSQRTLSRLTMGSRDKGLFKAKQCNGTSTCWCVDTAGVRRTDKDSEISCSEPVRTYWIVGELKHKREKPYEDQSLYTALKEVIISRYQLDPKYITDILYENDAITVDLVQNSQEIQNDVDIDDVAYYFEKDVKGESLFQSKRMGLKGLQAGIMAVIVVVAIAVTAGIMLVVSRKKRMAKYEKAEIKDMGEMHWELKQSSLCVEVHYCSFSAISHSRCSKPSKHAD